ncbi:MAG: AMP-binding protein [Candidatus Sumerlaeia bacterium]|nr:AMP-binding protein [Candidatus Sumerlaeia bacterium]
MVKNLVRLFIATVFRILYRVDLSGVENVPSRGGVLLVGNHQSYLDAVVVGLSTPRNLTFIIHRKMYNHPLVWPIARMWRTIPIDAEASPRDLITALRDASSRIKDGEVVCIFAEGQLTRTGNLLPFKRGVERIMRDSDAVMVPFCIDGLTQSCWGRPWGKLKVPRPRLHRRPIQMRFGKPMKEGTPVHVARQQVSLLLTEAFEARREFARPLHETAIRALRCHPLQKRYTDHNTPKAIPNYKALAAVVVLGEKLKPHWGREKCVGLLLPPAIGSMAINIAALTAGRVPVNLNYTVGPDTMEKICDNARIRVVITSREFVEKIRMKLPDHLKVVYTEDIRDSVTSRDRLHGMLRGMFLPIRDLERHLGRKRRARLNDVATLIYSSGSTGVPKGVMLTHWNVLSNMLGTVQVFRLNKKDRLLGVLPFFHSFGYTVGIWLPFGAGIPVSYYPNPLDARALADITRRDRVSIIFGTPTFLSSYSRRLMGGEFGSVRAVVTGAEKLRDYIAANFRETFGIEPREGFGCTETSPVVSINCEHFRETGLYQKGHKPGTIGLPIPGVSTRIMDIDTGEELAPGKEGMLQVKGPNIMKGYHRMPDKTAEAIVDGGWYVTGDVAKIDEEGFITITDRLSRFSKVGGEMVPHIRVEQALQEAISLNEQVFAVTGIPDKKKGERLVVLYTVEKDEARKACDELPKMGVPGIWQPRFADFIYVEEIPILGSGKMDLKQLRQIALEHFGEEK